MPLEKLHPNERCIKCGFDVPGMTFEPYRAGSTLAAAKQHNLLALKCFRCGFEWDRLPLDAVVDEDDGA